MTQNSMPSPFTPFQSGRICPNSEVYQSSMEMTLLCGSYPLTLKVSFLYPRTIYPYIRMFRIISGAYFAIREISSGWVITIL